MKISELQKINFKSLPLNEKLEIMKNGRPTPHIRFDFENQKKGALMSKKIDDIIFKKIDWLCGCEERNSLFCFICLLFGGDDDWTKQGITDIKQLPLKLRKHENSAVHKNNLINFLLEGKVKISPSFNYHCSGFVENHNRQVEKNLYNLSKIIDMIKLCGFCDLSLAEDEKKDKMMNCDIISEILEYSRKIDVVLDSNFENNNNTFKNISQLVQYEILSCIVNVYRLHIYDQIRESSFLTCMVEDITDVTILKGIEVALILRYEFQGKIYERFWGFLSANNFEKKEEGLSGCLLKELEPLVDGRPDKFIALTYNGMTSFKTRSENLRQRIKEIYNSVHHIHSYSHKLTYIIEQLSYQVSSAQIFFGNIRKVSDFFMNFPERVAELQHIYEKMPKELDFRNNPIKTIFEHRQIIMEFLENIKSGNFKLCDTESMQQAADLSNWFKDKTFLFWLTFFQKLMPEVEYLDEVLYTSSIDVTKIELAISNFQHNLMKFKNIFSATKSLRLLTDLPNEDELHLLTDETSEVELKEPNSGYEEDERIIKRITDFIFEESRSDSDFNKMNFMKHNSEISLNEMKSCSDFESTSLTRITTESDNDLRESESIDNCINSDSVTSEKIKYSTSEIKDLSCKLSTVCGSDLTAQTNIEIDSQTKLKHTYDQMPYDCDLNVAALMICENILREIEERFEFKDHLYGPQLFVNNRYERYRKKLPNDAINKLTKAFPVIEKSVFKTELDIFYKRSELHKPFMNSVSCLKTLNLFMSCGLHLAFKEITKVLRIIITLPIITRESARCKSTIGNVRKYLKIHKDKNELKVLGLTVLHVEKEAVKEIPDFNNKVIEMFINKEKKTEFHYMTGIM